MKLSDKRYKFKTNDGREYEFYLLPADTAEKAYSFITTNEGSTGAIDFIFDLITKSMYKGHDLEAGIVINMIFACLKMSGIIKDQAQYATRIEEKREELEQNIYYIMYRYIVKAQPSFTLEILKTKTLEELIELFTFSEGVLGSKILDTDKLKASVAKESDTGKVVRGVKSVTTEEIDMLKNILSDGEFTGDGFA